MWTQTQRPPHWTPWSESKAKEDVINPSIGLCNALAALTAYAWQRRTMVCARHRDKLELTKRNAARRSHRGKSKDVIVVGSSWHRGPDPRTAKALPSIGRGHMSKQAHTTASWRAKHVYKTRLCFRRSNLELASACRAALPAGLSCLEMPMPSSRLLWKKFVTSSTCKLLVLTNCSKRRSSGVITNLGYLSEAMSSEQGINQTGNHRGRRAEATRRTAKTVTRQRYEHPLNGR